MFLHRLLDVGRTLPPSLTSSCAAQAPLTGPLHNPSGHHLPRHQYGQCTRSGTQQQPCSLPPLQSLWVLFPTSTPRSFYLRAFEPAPSSVGTFITQQAAAPVMVVNISNSTNIISFHVYLAFYILHNPPFSCYLHNVGSIIIPFL